MAVPAVGTAVRVRWAGLGYEVLVPGQILATADTWTEDALPDMSPVLDANHAHVGVLAASGQGLSAYLLLNLVEGTGIDEYQIV